ncbi:bifunctional diguanylate cyclase/phosphodiesterase [Labrenzia sp. CE80]|uniref:putative bifunctional diguanylate cyclase/phosphodiesterase n=1 Tax=Labrenzia sp. CE80 TaxID=1788986 RepID=UPI00129BC87C|nr:bifunctional diguanylate cyclase/phosphodiesterase [Labrenzia sp. CE80]
MTRRPLKIHRWLISIVVLLLAPSLLFATLWIRNTLSDVHAVDRSMAGLEMLIELEPDIRAAALGDTPITTPPKFDARNRLAMPKMVHNKLLEDYVILKSDVSVSEAVRRARDIVRAIVHGVDLTSVTGPDSAELPYLVSDSILSVVLESSAMVQTGNRIAQKDELNLWDKMAVTVQGGQFKVAADLVSRVTNQYFSMLQMQGAGKLQALAESYRDANGSYQKAGAELLTTTLQSDLGITIAAGPASSSYPVLATACLDLWRGIIDYLAEELAQTRQAKIVAVVTASSFGLVVILLALSLATVLGRSLAARTRKEFDHLGYEDALTGLPNRRALVKSLSSISLPDDNSRVAILHLDIRRFKAINSRFGDAVGDEVLRMTGALLSSVVGDKGIVTRIGGTEFMILKPGIQNAAELKTFAGGLIRLLARERSIDGNVLRLDCCIGLSLTEPGQNVTNKLLVDATLAARSAKRKGTQNIELFSPDMRAIFEKNTETAKELHDALQSGNIVSWFQPQVDIATGQIVGAEALVRWVGIEDGVRFPGAFLPAAEEAGYMEAIDLTVRNQAMSVAFDMQAINTRAFHIGLNVSAKLLMDENCVEQLLAETRNSGLQPQQVSIEILEAVMIDAFSAAPIRANVNKLSELGFYIELDDFGTGHSSISSLRDLKINRVKIDRSYVAGVDQNPELQRFTGALMQLARSLGISILAEGVETEGEQRWLQANGCDVIQGFLISPAIPREQLFAMVGEQAFIMPQTKQLTS